MKKVLMAAALLAVSGAAHAVSALQQVAPSATSFVEAADFLAIGYSGAGDVTAHVTPVDLWFGFGNASTSGCEAADFAGFAAGSIALIQRGTCTFELKAVNAYNAGALGVLIFNQGNDPTRLDVFGGTLTSNFVYDIPVFALSYGLGAQLAATPGLVVRMFQDVRAVPTPTPEPGSLLLLSLGLCALASGRRRKPA